MAKTIVKELIISLLLCLAILLLLGILLYEYVPMTKTIPNPVSYTTPENVKKELAETEGVDEDQIIMTYEVDSTDLNNYKNIQDYKPGKANPFSSYETAGTNTTTANATTGNTNSGTTTSGTTTGTENGSTMNSSMNSNNSNNTNISNGTPTTSTEDNTNTSGGQFFQDKGTK